ncbi:hypothetical protein J4U01_gp103 [Mycobacterium phage Kumao]|uniref:Uncharacterized protein n=1 Tax=Mycobacterium phage Kumao TaxID=2041344 RepID=A0A2D1GQ12_9CAUD|nr:hypothetical protein J4U01_gp103 [Mycobacterium phage Kumao]ATN94055.1 hypothetical protein SEA_KUMAO_93 [Mycobacterium phage Kumao]
MTALIPQYVQSELYLFRPTQPQNGALVLVPRNVDIITLQDEQVNVGQEVRGVALTKNLYNFVYLDDEDKSKNTQEFAETIIHPQLRAVFCELRDVAQSLIAQVANTEHRGTLLTVAEPVPFGTVGAILEVDGIFYRWTITKDEANSEDISLVDVLVGTKVD